MGYSVEESGYRSAPSPHQDFMAEKTDKLISDCTEAKKSLDEAVEASSNALTALEKSIVYVEGLEDDSDRNSFSKHHESSVSNRTFARSSIDRLISEKDRSKSSIKALASKVRTKGVLNVFSTQASLGKAKKALEEIEEAHENAVSKISIFEKIYTNLETRVSKQSDRSALIWKAEPILKDLAQFLKLELPNAENQIELYLKAIEKIGLQIKQYGIEVNSKAPWETKAVEQRVSEAQQLIGQLEKIKTELNKLARSITDAVMPGRWDDFAKVAKFPPVKGKMIEAQKALDKVLRLHDAPIETIPELQTSCEVLIADMELVEATDAPQKDEQTLQKELVKARDQMENLEAGIIHSIVDFNQQLDELRNTAGSLREYISAPNSISEEQWDHLEGLRGVWNIKIRDTKQLFSALDRVFTQSKKYPKRFPQDEEILRMSKKMEASMLEKEKQYKNLQKAIPAFLEFIDKVLQKRPKK